MLALQPDRDAPLIAVTGASGFIGRRLVPTLERVGYRVRVLMRRKPGAFLWEASHPEVIAGDLGDEAALCRLARGAEVVIHLAGLIKATSKAAFYRVNGEGSGRVAQAARAAGAELLYISSLAARQPQLSSYAASKRAGEDAVQAVFGTHAQIFRPAAVYGPGDPETLIFFKMATGRFAPLVAPPRARAAVIHVDDLCELVVAQLRMGAIDQAAGRAVAVATDDRPQGYSWREILHTAAAAVGNDHLRMFQAPMPLLVLVSRVGDIASRLGNPNLLTTQKMRELRYPDWSATPAERACPGAWQPRYDLAAGFAHAVVGYRALGWLPGV